MGISIIYNNNNNMQQLHYTAMKYIKNAGQCGDLTYVNWFI